MYKKKLSDREAKDILREWPARATVLWSTPRGKGRWIRAQPKDAGSSVTAPRIGYPGAKLFHTQPDGMWVYLADAEFADVVCVESCCNSTNLNDKRSRYGARVGSMVLHVPRPWLRQKMRVQRGAMMPRWEAAESISTEPKRQGVLVLPVRFCQVLFALPNDEYAKWTANNVPAGHEYFCRHSSLNSWKSQKMQDFLNRMSFASHFYTEPGR